MAIVVREDREIRGKLFKDVKVYRPGGYLTKKDKERADSIDSKLESEFRKMEGELKKKGLLALRGKRGKVVELWWEVGKRLSFIDDFNLDEDEYKLIWVAIYYHAGKLAPGPLSKRAERSPETSHFAYCYRLGKFSKDAVMSQDWTAWYEFFDSKVIRNDPRIIDWLNKKIKEEFSGGSRQNWLRKLTKAIRNSLKNTDTKYWSKEELEEKLEEIFRETY